MSVSWLPQNRKFTSCSVNRWGKKPDRQGGLPTNQALRDSRAFDCLAKSTHAISATDLLSRNRHRVRLSGRINRQLDEIPPARLFFIGDEICRRVILFSGAHVAMKLIDPLNVFFTL